MDGLDGRLRYRDGVIQRGCRALGDDLLDGVDDGLVDANIDIVCDLHRFCVKHGDNIIHGCVWSSMMCVC